MSKGMQSYAEAKSAGSRSMVKALVPLKSPFENASTTQ